MSTIHSQAYEGYESLAGVNFVSHDDIRMIVDTTAYLVQTFWNINGLKN